MTIKADVLLCIALIVIHNHLVAANNTTSAQIATSEPHSTLAPPTTVQSKFVSLKYQFLLYHVHMITRLTAHQMSTGRLSYHFLFYIVTIWKSA